MALVWLGQTHSRPPSVFPTQINNQSKLIAINTVDRSPVLHAPFNWLNNTHYNPRVHPVSPPPARGSILRRNAITLAPVVRPRPAQHPVDLLDETLLGLALGSYHLPAEVVECLGHLVHVLGGGNFAKLALKVLGQDFALVGADLSQVDHVHLVADQRHRGRVARELLLRFADVVERIPIGDGVHQE